MENVFAVFLMRQARQHGSSSHHPSATRWQKGEKKAKYYYHQVWRGVGGIAQPVVLMVTDRVSKSIMCLPCFLKGLRILPKVFYSPSLLA